MSDDDRPADTRMTEDEQQRLVAFLNECNAKVAATLTYLRDETQAMMRRHAELADANCTRERE